MSDGSAESNGSRNETVERDGLPGDVYASHTDCITLGMKTVSAKRMVDWLRGYAEVCELMGSTQTAEDAWHFSNALANEVEPESVEKREFGQNE